MSEVVGRYEEHRGIRSLLDSLSNVARGMGRGLEYGAFEQMGLTPQDVERMDAAIAASETSRVGSAAPQEVVAELPPDIEVRIQNPGLFDD